MRSRTAVVRWEKDFCPQEAAALPDLEARLGAQALERSRDFIFRNTYKDIEYILKEIGEGYGTRFEF